MPQFLKPISLFVSDFVRFKPNSHFVLINDSGIFYFQISDNNHEIITSVQLSDYPDFNQCLKAFVKKLASTGAYQGQPITLLIGGSNCFYQIKAVSKQATANPSKLFDYLDLDNIILKFRYFVLEKTKTVFYSGIKSSLYKEINETLNSNSILFDELQPITLFVLENYLIPFNIKTATFKFPGQVIWTFNDNGKISLVEKSAGEIYPSNFFESDFLLSKNTEYFSFFEKDIKNTNKSVKPLYEFIKKPKFELKKKLSFFNRKNDRQTSLPLSPISTALKYVSLIVVALSIVSLLALGTLKIWEMQYIDILNRHQSESALKENLKDEIVILNKEIKEKTFTGGVQTYFAGALSTFCQKRPWGLYLQEISVLGNSDNGWSITALGVTEKENRVFEYQKQISQFANDLLPEVTFIREDKVNQGGRNQNVQKKYSFKIKLGLDNQK